MVSDRPGLATVLIPAFNEGQCLAAHLRDVIHVLLDDTTRAYEILIVDDGSSDDTYELACAAAAANSNVRVLRHDVNRGLGCALRTGFADARGYAIVVYDSDVTYRPQIIPRLLDELDRSNADVVLASAYMRGGEVRNVPWLRRVLSREANRFLSFAMNARYATATCMVRAYRAYTLRNIGSTEDRMEINVELLFNAIRANAKIVEIPASLDWGSTRATTHRGVPLILTLRQMFRTLQYGVGYRPAVLLAVPGLIPGLLPAVVAIAALMHASLKTIAIVTIATLIVQYGSLALFAGQLAVFTVLTRVMEQKLDEGLK